MKALAMAVALAATACAGSRIAKVNLAPGVTLTKNEALVCVFGTARGGELLCMTEQEAELVFPQPQIPEESDGGYRLPASGVP